MFNPFNDVFVKWQKKQHKSVKEMHRFKHDNVLGIEITDSIKNL